MNNEQQIEFERECLEAGKAKYQASHAKAQARGTEDQADYGLALAAEVIEPGVTILTKYLGEVATQPGRKAAAYPYLKGIDPNAAVLLAVRCFLSRLSGERSLYSLAKCIGRAVRDHAEAVATYRPANKDDRAKRERLYTGVIDNLTRNPMGRSDLVRRRQIRHAADKAGFLTRSNWTEEAIDAVGTLLLDVLCEIGLATVETVREKHGKRVKSTTRVIATDKVREFVANFTEMRAAFRPIRHPMIVPPRDWITPYCGGYFTYKERLIHRASEAYLKEMCLRDQSEVYAAVNALQRTPWMVNTFILKLVQRALSTGMPLADIPGKEPLPKPPQPPKEDKAAYAVWCRRRSEINLTNQQNKELLVEFSAIRDVAERMMEFSRFWYPMFLDFRGRVYCSVPHLNIQGQDVAKALLLFADGKPLGPDGVWWLRVHLANTWGYDKCSMQDRVQWTLDREQEIVGYTNDPWQNRGWEAADKPWQFLAACHEYAMFMREGESYVCSLPILVDGSVNGIQNYSALLRDEICGRQVNLIPQPTPADLYQTVADALKVRLEAILIDPNANGQDREAAGNWLKVRIDRKLTKRGCMVLPYGGTKEAITKYIRDRLLELKKAGEELPEWGYSLRTASRWLANIQWAVMQEIIVKPMQAMAWLRQVAELVVRENVPVCWTSPSGFVVQQGYRQQDVVRVRLSAIGRVYRYTRRLDRPNEYNKRRQAQAIAPNFVHSLDASALVKTVVLAQANGVDYFAAIHDSYGTLPCDMPMLQACLRQAFVDQYSGDVLGRFISEITAVLPEGVEPPPPPKPGTLDLNAVIESDFFFS